MLPNGNCYEVNLFTQLFMSATVLTVSSTLCPNCGILNTIQSAVGITQYASCSRVVNRVESVAKQAVCISQCNELIRMHS